MPKHLGMCLSVLGLFAASVAQGAGNPLPQEVSLVERKAEDALDQLLKNDWVGAQALIDSIDQSESKIEKEIYHNNLPRSLSLRCLSVT